MNGITWSFRDLANHLFPGIIISFPIFYIINADMDINYDAGAAVIFAFLILSYIIGFSVDSVSKINRWANKAIRLFRADPLKKVFKRYNLCEEINDPETFEGIALQLIQKRFGGSLLENEYRTAIIYYMLREIESKNSFLANFISRISALENMCRNIGLACLVLQLLFILPASFPVADGRLFLMLPSPEGPCPYECGGDRFGQDEACDQAADFRGGHQPGHGADHAAVRSGLVLSRLLSASVA